MFFFVYSLGMNLINFKRGSAVKIILDLYGFTYATRVVTSKVKK